MQRAAIYARISSDPNGDQLGVSRQLQDCRELAQRRGWTVVTKYVDDDVSAYNGRFGLSIASCFGISATGLSLPLLCGTWTGFIGSRRS